MCLDRIIRNRDNVELFEEIERLEIVRERYFALKNYFDNTVIVTGDRDKDIVSKEIQEVVEKTLYPTR